MKVVLVSALALLGAAPAAFAQNSSAIHNFGNLSLAPAGDKLVAVESIDPGNLPKEPHGAVVVRGAEGKVIATYDPCKACKYANTAWSPKGALAFTGTASGKATIYVVEGGKLRAATVVNGVANTLRFSPDGSRLAALVTLGAHKLTGATEAGAALTGEIGASNDEQRIAVMPVAGGTLTPISPADTYVYEYGWTPDGKGFAATAAKGNGDNNWWVAKLVYVDAKSGAARVIAAPKMQLDQPRVSPDGKTVAFIGGLMSDWGATGGDIYTVPLAGGTPVDVTPGYKGTFDGVVWRGNVILTSAQIDDRASAVSIDPASHATRVLWSAPVSDGAQRMESEIAYSADGTTAASVLSDYTHAPEIALGKLPKLAPITHENAALPANVSAQSVHWKNEGFGLQGWLIGPKAPTPGKHPMIVIVHGGPSSSVTPHYLAMGGQHGTGFDFTGDMIAKGYYFFYPNDRGSYGQGEAFTRANMKDFGHGDLRDMLAGVDAVEKVAPIDDKRLGLYGHSYGGWFSMWANTQTRRFKAFVAGAGIANWTSYYGQNGIDQWMIPFFGASVYDDPAVYRKSSPIEFIKNAKTPTFIYVGERDVECPAPQSLEYWHALHDLGTPVQLFIYPGEGHHFTNPQHLIDLRARIIAWFEKYLK